MLPVAHRQLVELGERIERTGRTVKSMAAAKVAESAWRGDGDRSAEDRLARTTGTTRSRGGQGARDGTEPPGRAGGRPGSHRRGAVGEADRGDRRGGRGRPDRGGPAPAERQGQGSAGAAGRVPRRPHPRRPRSEATRARIHAKRSYRTWTDPDGTGHLHLCGPSDVIARLDNAVPPPLRAPLPRRPPRRAPRAHRRLRHRRRRRAPHQQGRQRPRTGGADAKIIVRVDLEALLRGRRRGDLRDRRARPDPGIDRAGVDGQRLPRRHRHPGHRDHQGRPPRPELHQRAAHRPAVARPGLRPQGLRQPPRPPVRPLRGLGRHPHHTVRAGRRFCPPCHRLKTLGWNVSHPDAEGQCTFTPPSNGPVEDNGDQTLPPIAELPKPPSEPGAAHSPNPDRDRRGECSTALRGTSSAECGRHARRSPRGRLL